MALFDWLKPAPPLDAATREHIERAVTLVEPLMRLVSHYQARLAPGVRRAMAHCAAIAERIPGPFDISRSAFVNDPLVHALFGSADDIETMLARSQCLREQGAGGESGDGQWSALLGMRPRQKAGYGPALLGDALHLDVPQKTLYFTDHTLAEPCADPQAARARLRLALYDGLLKDFAAHVAEARAEYLDLTQSRAIESARARAVVGPESHTRRLAELSARLSAGAEALRPEALLETLSECLAAPERLLSIEPVQIAVDRNGIITGLGSEAGVILRFMELSGRDKRRWVVILANIRNDEARHAIERIEAARRYIVI